MKTKFSFKARIYKVGINPCVKVPATITQKMIAVKGYIPVKGKIGKFGFIQTLVPVKNDRYRLYVNGPMLKGSNTAVGETVSFTIEQDFNPHTRNISMPLEFRQELNTHNLYSKFKSLLPSRQKEILKYLNYLKTAEARDRNIKKVIAQLNSML